MQNETDAMTDQLLLEGGVVGRWSATIWPPSPLRNLRNALLQNLVIKRIKSLPLWKVAIAPKHDLLALLTQEGELEISELNPNGLVVKAKIKVLKDTNSDLCLLEWTASENLLISTRSNAVVDVFEPGGNFCYSIPLEGSLTADFDAMRAVCQLVSRISNSSEPKWMDELFVLQFNGRLRCYFVGRLSGYHPLFELDVCQQLSTTLTSAMCLVSNPDLLLVSSQYRVNDQRGNSPEDMGLGIWRFTNDSNPELLMWTGTRESSIVCMNVNCDQSLLAYVTADGDVGLLQLPSFQCLAFVRHRDVETGDSFDTADIPTQIGWWSRNEVAVLFASGALALCPATDDDLRHCVMGRCTWRTLSTCAQLLVPKSGRCLILECQARLDDASPSLQDASLALDNPLWLLLRVLAVTLYGWTKLAIGAAVGQPFHEVHIPCPQDATSRRVKFLLHQFTRTAPEEACRKKLDAKQYEEALNLARIYPQIDPDVIHKRQWTDLTEITRGEIDSILRQVKDVDWALKECLTKSVESSDAFEALFEHGLSLTDGKADELNHRILLFHYLDMLDVCLSTFDANSFIINRDMSILQLSINFLRFSKFRSFASLLYRFPAIIRPHLLPLLSQISEIENPNDYDFLLPNMTNGLLKWTEDDDSQRYRDDPLIRNHLDDPIVNDTVRRLARYNTIYETEADLIEFRMDIYEAISADLLPSWYRFRANSIEFRTGLPHMFVRFVRLAVDKGIPTLELLLADAEMYASTVSYCGDSGRSFEQFKSANVSILVKSLMDQIGSNLFVSALDDRVVPYLLHCEHLDRCIAKDQLFTYLIDRAASSLSPIRQFLSSLTDSMSSQLDISLSDLVHLAEQSLISFDSTGDHLLLPASQLLSVTPCTELLRKSNCFQAADRLDTLDGCLETLQLLAVHDVHLSFVAVKMAVNDRDETLRVLTMLIRRAPNGHWSTVDWQRLYDDVQTIVHRLFRTVTVQDCLELFVSGLLSSSNSTTIAYATEFMTSLSTDESCSSTHKLLPSRAIELALISARDHANSAINCRDPSISLARSVLSTVSSLNSPEISAESDMLTALELLAELGVEDLPVNIRVVDDRQELVKRAVEAKANNYKQTKKLAELGRLLRVVKPAGVATVICAIEAMRRGDAKICGRYCSHIVDSGLIKGWPVCREAADCGLITDHQLQLRLYSFSLLHCHGDDIEETLQSRNMCKINAIKHDLNTGNDLTKWCRQKLTDLEESLTSMDSLPVDALYSSPELFQFSIHSTVIEDGLSDLSNILQLIYDDESFFHRCTALLASFLLRFSATTALGCLLALKDRPDLAEKVVMKSAPKSTHFLLYLFALLTSQGIHRQLIEKTAPQILISTVWKYRHQIESSPAIDHFNRFVELLQKMI